jgi:hypothetical protein
MIEAHKTMAGRHLRLLFEAGTAAGLGDGPLLERFLERGDQAAFAMPDRAARADGP